MNITSYEDCEEQILDAFNEEVEYQTQCDKEYFLKHFDEIVSEFAHNFADCKSIYFDWKVQALNFFEPEMNEKFKELQKMDLEKPVPLRALFHDGIVQLVYGALRRSGKLRKENYKENEYEALAKAMRAYVDVLNEIVNQIKNPEVKKDSYKENKEGAK